MNVINFVILAIFVSGTRSAVTDEEYANLPSIFHYDDYDQCMQLGDKALYCSIKYELQPYSSKSVPKIWHTIQELKEEKFNYRHDHLRHWICVPKTCSNINVTEKSINLQSEINQCYNAKFKENNLTGQVTEILCDTNKPRYPVDLIDILGGLLLISYISFVMYASFKDTSIDENQSVNKPKLVTAFSIPKNWQRLKYVKEGEETQEFRVFQGVRFYNILIVIFSHTGLYMTGGPIANTRYTERLHETVSFSLFTAGPFCVGTNFFLSSFLLTYGFYYKAENGKMSFKRAMSFFINRCIRLLPILFFRWLLSITWLRHWGDGPVWYFFVESDFLDCRRQGWTNFLFMHTIIGKESMCLPVTWYLAQDTQFYFITVILLWIFIKYPKLIWPVLTTILTVCVVGVFLENYIPDYPIILMPYREFIYGLNAYRGASKQYRTKNLSYFGNPIPTIMGIAFGYLFYLDRDGSIFNKYKKWLPSEFTLFLVGLGISLFPGTLLMVFRVSHHRIWLLLFLAVSRLIFHSSITLLMYSCSRGQKGISKNILEWSPTYILGRLSYSAYMMHDLVIFLRVAMSRSPLYLTDYVIVSSFCSDILATFLVALLVTLFIELPSTAVVSFWNNREVNGINEEEKKKVR